MKTTNNEPKPQPVEAKAQTAQAIDLHRLIRCLEEIEGGQWNWPGGKLRVTRAFWHDHSLPIYNYRQSTDPDIAREVVSRGLIWMISELRTVNREATIELLARIYNQGWNGAMGSLDKKSDYAERVANLYNDKGFNP